MFRLIGFLTGVAVTVVVLAALVDVPTRERAKTLATAFAGRTLDLVERATKEAGGSGSAPVAGTPAAASEGAPVHQPRSAEETGTATTAVSREPISEPRARIRADEEGAPVPAPQPGTAVTPAAERRTRAAPARAVEHAGAQDVTGPGTAWEPVWRAFRSELSAKGFAGHLERLTGQAYRVRRTSPWTYQVELRYTDAAERDALLREIQRSTGLGLVDVSP